MVIRQPRYAKEEFAQRGNEIYERAIRPQVESGNHGRFVAVDIESGNWEMDSDDFTATERLLVRVPDAQIWLIRIGSDATYRIGGPKRTEIVS